MDFEKAVNGLLGRISVEPKDLEKSLQDQLSRLPLTALGDTERIAHTVQVLAFAVELLAGMLGIDNAYQKFEKFFVEMRGREQSLEAAKNFQLPRIWEATKPERAKFIEETIREDALVLVGSSLVGPGEFLCYQCGEPYGWSVFAYALAERYKCVDPSDRQWREGTKAELLNGQTIYTAICQSKRCNSKIGEFRLVTKR